MTTNNSVNVGLIGATGTGSFVGSISPILITPNLGIPTSLALTNSTGDQIGTNTNDDAASGKVGEYISTSVLVGSAVSLTSATSVNVAVISNLPAGDWEVRGQIAFNPAGLTTATSLSAAINISSHTMPTIGSENNTTTLNISIAAGQPQVLNVGTMRISLSSASNVYLIANATFAVSTMTGYGFIGARRAR